MRIAPIPLVLAVATAFAVETKPVHILKVLDGGTIAVQADLGGVPLPAHVRLAYVVSPGNEGDAPGDGTPEARSAKAALDDWVSLNPEGLAQVVDANRPHTGFTLWSPGGSLEQDSAGDVIAVLNQRVVRGRTVIKGPKGHQIASTEYETMVLSAEEYLVSRGWAVYARQHGDAPEPLHATLLDAEQRAKAANAGAWATAPGWMQEHADRRSDADAPQRQQRLAALKEAMRQERDGLLAEHVVDGSGRLYTMTSAYSQLKAMCTPDEMERIEREFGPPGAAPKSPEPLAPGEQP